MWDVPKQTARSLLRRSTVEPTTGNIMIQAEYSENTFFLMSCIWVVLSTSSMSVQRSLWTLCTHSSQLWHPCFTTPISPSPTTTEAIFTRTRVGCDLQGRESGLCCVDDRAVPVFSRTGCKWLAKWEKTWLKKLFRRPKIWQSISR